MHWVAVGLLAMPCAAFSPAMANDGLLAAFPAEGSLALADGSMAVMTRGAEAGVRYVPGRTGQGIYVAPGHTLAIPVPELNPREGTLSFWFRPDWSDPCSRHSILAELTAGDAWRLGWAYGYPHIPGGVYVNVNTGPKWTGAKVSGSLYEGSHNLFTGGEWRHYALRWSAERGTIEMVVDGYTCPRGGRYTCEQMEPRDAHLLLSGEVRGALDEVRVYDRWLDDDALIAAGGVTVVRTYLQEQQPPPGAPRAGLVGREVRYVDPATGAEVTATVAETAGVYNPDDMPELPETPHTRWARPLAGGPVKVLMVMPGAFYNELQTLLREGVELWQRLDMVCHIADTLSPELEAADYEVIVVSHQGMLGSNWQGWTSLEEPLRDWIVARVASGRSGLVFAYPMQLDNRINALFRDRRLAAPLLRGFPVEAMHKAVSERHDPVHELPDAWFETHDNLAKHIVEVYENDGFRAVKLNYVMGGGWGLHTGLTPDTAVNFGATLAHYDVWMALAARAVLYAAGREPSARIEKVDFDLDEWKVRLAGTGAKTLWYRARDWWGRVYAQGEAPVSGVEVVLPAVPLAPRCMVDLILKNQAGETLDWFSRTVPPIPGVRVDAITLAKPSYAKGETVLGRVGLTAPGTGRYRLEVYLGDHEGRRLVRTEQPVEGGATEVAFALAIPESSDSLMMRLDAILWDGNRIVAERSADCPVPCKAPVGFFAMMYGSNNNRAPNLLTRRLFRDRYSVNTMTMGGTRAYYNPNDQLNLHHICEVAHGFGLVHNEETFKPFIEDWDQFFPKNLVREPEKSMIHRPLFSSLGEEHYLILGGSRHPEALKRFHTYLRGRYDSLEQLNEVWNASFRSWDEIPMVKPDVVDVMKLDFGVQQFESRRFMEHLFAQKHADQADWLRARDPSARVGIHVGWDLWMGRSYDYWLLSRGMDSMIGYGGVQNQYIRSFFKNYYGSWYHYALGDHDNTRWHPWYMVLSGAKGVGWYTMSPQIWGATTGDLHPSSDWVAGAPEYKAAAEAGDLLTRATYLQDQAAIHYSQDSMHAGMGPALSWLHNNMVNLLFDDGVPSRFVSNEELAAGKANGTPLLILPGSISLSPGEAEAIRAYVRQGGTVWADRLPGAFDHHGRKLEKSQLADLFENLEEQTLPGGGKLQVGCDGRVILAALDNYAFSRNVGEHLSARALLDEIVKRAGVKRVARALTSDGAAANAIWLAGWRQGRQRYLVAAKDYAVVDRSPVRVVIVFDGPAHVYEGRGGRYLGRHDRIGDTLETARGKLYALLPYRVDSIEAKTRTGWLSRRARRGEDLRIDIKLQASGNIGPDDLHLLRLAVTGPDRREVTALRREVCVFAGEGVVRLPVACNDPAGEYTVRLHDTATGMERSIGYALE